MTERSYFVYLHRRPDKNVVFYVGRGKKYTRCSPTFRAYDERRRSAQWKSIVARNNGIFHVEIVCWCDSLEEVLQKEREYIRRFGKQIDGTGTLINLTDGGDGSLGLKHSDAARRKMSDAWHRNPARSQRLHSDAFKAARRAKLTGLPGPMTGKKHKSETIEAYKAMRRGAGNVNARTVKNLVSGAIYGCVEDAAKALGIGKWSLYKALSGERPNRTMMEYC